MATELARTPCGSKNQAINPYSTEVMASPTNSHLKEYLARKLAVAGPKAKPAFKAQRKAAKAVTRCSGVTKSASNAVLAGRYNSVVSPASAVRDTMIGSESAPESSNMETAEE